MAASISRSMPALKALPAPMTMTTRAFDCSTSSSADCRSQIMRVEMALRLSGRFTVSLAMSPSCSSSSVSYISQVSPHVAAAWCAACVTLILVHLRGVRILCAHFVGEAEHIGQLGRVDLEIITEIGADFLQCGEDLLGGDVADEIVARKGAAAESGERGVEAPATGFVRGEDFGFRVFGPAVQVHAELDSSDVLFDAAIEIADEFGRGGAHGVCERDRVYANIL